MRGELPARVSRFAVYFGITAGPCSALLGNVGTRPEGRCLQRRSRSSGKVGVRPFKAGGNWGLPPGIETQALQRLLLQGESQVVPVTVVPMPAYKGKKEQEQGKPAQGTQAIRPGGFAPGRDQVKVNNSWSSRWPRSSGGLATPVLALVGPDRESSRGLLELAYYDQSIWMPEIPSASQTRRRWNGIQREYFEVRGFMSVAAARFLVVRDIALTMQYVHVEQLRLAYTSDLSALSSELQQNLYTP